MKKKVVVIGGGNGSALVNNALKPLVRDIDISSVVSVCDSGGANGRLRERLGVLPSADVLRAVLALSPYNYGLLKKIFRSNRFSEGKFEGHYLGNLFLMLVARHTGDYIGAVRSLEDAVEAVGTVHPVTLDQSDLCVELSDGEIVIGEGVIDRPTNSMREHRIIRAWLQPTPMIYDGARDAISSADYIIFAPGSLYTSLIATLVVEGMKKGALRHSNAKFVFVVGNAYEKNGEVGPTILSEVISELETYLPRPLDIVVYNNRTLTKQEKVYYQKKQWGLLDIDVTDIEGTKIIAADFERKGGGIDVTKLSKVLQPIIL